MNSFLKANTVTAIVLFWINIFMVVWVIEGYRLIGDLKEEALILKAININLKKGCE